MTFFASKDLALGPIRFGVAPRKPMDAIDTDPAFSTGAAGEFIRRRGEGYFFGDKKREETPAVRAAQSVRTTSFLSSLKPGSGGSYGFVAMMVIGLLLMLLGLAVLKSKGPQGWVEIIFGFLLIVTPLVLTARKRGQLIAQEERERAEREAIERRNEEMLSKYHEALDRLRTDRSDDALDRLRIQREALTLPFELWGTSARGLMLQIGFDELARRGPARSAEVTALIQRSGEAAGLFDKSIRQVLRDLYLTFLWHLLADDRLGPAQQEQLRALANGLQVEVAELALETSVIDQFERLRGITGNNLPKRQCTMPLVFQEHCIHETPAGSSTLHLTDRRVILAGKKPVNEIPLPKLFDLEVDIDKALLTMKSNQKKPLELTLTDPLYSAALIDIARSLDTRPRGFA